ncbi:MAG: hypothetical protein Q7V05_12890 [Methanoregula sp.]|nr:hypothetical protein [Methanoregula sp.]
MSSRNRPLEPERYEGREQRTRLVLRSALFLSVAFLAIWILVQVVFGIRISGVIIILIIIMIGIATAIVLLSPVIWMEMIRQSRERR